MSNDLMDRLRRENPVPEDLPILPIEPVLRRLDDAPAALPDRTSATRGRARRATGGLPVALSVIVAFTVAAVVITTGRHTQPAGPTRGATSTQSIARFAASQFAVFSRPQTVKDRSLPAVLGRAVRLGGLGPGFESILHGAIPSLTRYTQTLPDGREVFLAVYHPSEFLPGGAPKGLDERLAKSRDESVSLRLIIVQPNGKWTDGQPVLDPGGSYAAKYAYIEARAGRQGCGVSTYWNIVPNQVAQIRWQFPRQDAYGYVYKAPLTVNIPVHENTAVATIPTRASCDRPSVVTLYGHNGQILSHAGSATNLNRITRPIRRGNPTQTALTPTPTERHSLVLNDCLSHAHLTRPYTNQQLRDALAAMPTAVRKYTNCSSVIHRALASHHK